MFMRTKSSIRIMMTIIMKLVPLIVSLHLSIQLPRSAYSTVFERQSAECPECYSSFW